MRSFGPRIRGIALVCAISFSTSTTFAQSGAAPVVKPAAETLFEEGRTLMQQQRYADACSKFEASQALDAGIGTLLHLGDCYERLGKTASAWATFKEAASLSRVRGQEERERIAATRASALEQHLNHLTIRVPEAHRLLGLEIRIDGNPIPRATWESAIPVDPGSVSVEASAPKRVPFNTRIDIVPGAQDSVVEIPLLEVAGDASNAGASRTGESAVLSRSAADAGSLGSTQRTAGWILGGVGVVGLAVGSVLGLQAKHHKDDSLDYCPHDPNLCSPHGVDLRDQAKRDATGSTIAFAAGGSLLVSGILLLVTAPSRQEQTALSRVQLGLSLGRRTNALQIGSTF
jgi:hypothetical protein